MLSYSRVCDVRCQAGGAEEGGKAKGEEEQSLEPEMIGILVYASCITLLSFDTAQWYQTSWSKRTLL